VDEDEAAGPDQPEGDAAVLAERESRLADREAQRAVARRQDKEASISTWARRVHERVAQLHDQAEMAHRDAAERHALVVEHASGHRTQELPVERSE